MPRQGQRPKSILSFSLHPAMAGGVPALTAVGVGHQGLLRYRPGLFQQGADVTGRRTIYANRQHLCCLKLFRQKVTEAGVISDDELNAIDAEVAQLIDEAVAEAIAAPLPEAAKLTADVYVSY